MSREDHQLRIRLPDALKERVLLEADRNGRSMTAEIVLRLQDAYDALDARTKQLDFMSEIKEQIAAIQTQMAELGIPPRKRKVGSPADAAKPKATKTKP